MPYSLKELCKVANIDYSGEDYQITKINTLLEANESEISFFHNKRYLKDLPQTKAKAVLIEEKYAKFLPKSSIALITDEPYLKLALISKLFAYKPSTKSELPKVGKDCDIDSSAKFGVNVSIGDRSVIMAGVYIGDNCSIGEDCLIYPNVTIYHGTKIGKNCIIHSGAVIGSDGYGFAHTKDGRHIKFYQLGNTILEDDIEVGANTTIDRGAIKDTIIKRGTKIDNLVQIGHNCEIGENCLIVAQNGLAGSSKLGRNIVLGGQSAVAGHLEIGDFAQFAGRSAVTKSLEGGKIYAGAPAIDIKLWRKQQALLMRLAKGKK